jgi:hypothetical protein
MVDRAFRETGYGAGSPDSDSIDRESSACIDAALRAADAQIVELRRTAFQLIHRVGR